MLRSGRARLGALGANFLGRFAQLVITVGAGSIGAGYFLLRYHLAGWPLVGAGVAVGLVAVNASLLTVLLAAGPLARALLASSTPGTRRWARWLRGLTAYSTPELLAVLGWAGARYVVFAVQFGLLLAAFGVQSGVGEGALAVAGTFLLKSLVPSLSALTDLGTRELSAVHFFGLLGQPALPVLSASLCLWLLNIALPSAVGLVLLPGLRLPLPFMKRAAHRPRGRQLFSTGKSAVVSDAQPPV